MAAETTTKTPETAAAGQPDTMTAPPAKKRKTAKAKATADVATSGADTAEMPSAAPASSAPKPAPSQGKKRKATAAADTTPGAASKKPKRENPPPKTPKPRAAKRTKKATPVPAPPPPPTPAEVTAPVQAKISAVKTFLATEMQHQPSQLTHDPSNPHLVSLPELDLLGMIMTLYTHWELGAAETAASVSDVEDAIVERFKKPVGCAGDVDWVTLDLAVPTKLEGRIKAKIEHHGLEGAGLLEAEMEMFVRKNRARVPELNVEIEETVKAGDFLLRLVEFGWEGTWRKFKAELMKADLGAEKGRKGVCPAPAVEVV